MNQKIFLITGGNGLIGTALCNAISKLDNTLVLSMDLQHKPIENKSIIPIVGSVMDTNFLKSVSECIKNMNGQLSGIVNCAFQPEYNAKFYTDDHFKVMPPKWKARDYRILNEWLKCPASELTRAFETNVVGTHNVIASQTENLLNSDSASIVNIGSQYGIKVPNQDLFERDDKFVYKPAAYSVSKAAVIMYTEYLASVFAGSNVRINSFSPGNIETNHTEAFKTKYAKYTWAGRMPKLEEIIEPILFLLSEKSSYMTGGHLIVDGGWTRK